MTKKLLLKSLFLLLCMIGEASNVWANEVTFTPGTDTGETSVTKSSVTCTMNTMNNSSYYQIYANSSGTFSISSGSITKIEFTCTASGTSKYGPGNASANVGTYSYSGNKGTWTGNAESVTISSTAQVRMSSLTITYTPATPAYTITAQSNNDSYGTVSLSGSMITGSPKSGYRYASPAYTVDPENSATVAQEGDLFTVTPSANTTVTINFEAIPSHTATFSVNGITTSENYLEGANITFPDDPADINGKKFMGWITATIDGTTDEAPSFVNTASVEMGNSDITYYAVFASAEASGEAVETKIQTLQYDSWTYSGTTTNKTNYRLFGNGSYIESAAFDLSKLSKVIVYGGTYGGSSYNSLTIGDGTNTWKSGTVSGTSHSTSHTYTDGSTLTGTNKLRITATAGDGTSKGLRISKVEIFISQPLMNYSSYCTSVVVTTVETPVISPASGPVASGTEVIITCATDDASIYFTTDGATPTSSSTLYDPANKPTITNATTIKAIAVKGGLTDSEVASASYTIAEPCATPTFSVVAGEVAKGTTVTISTETDGATIYYTTNGTTPTTSSTVYSSAITINSAVTIKAIAAKEGHANSEVASASYTIIDYATLPFSFNNGKSSIASTTGLTESGLGSDYSSAPKLKFDSTNDYLILKVNEVPDELKFDIKGNGFSGGTFKVQYSADGSAYSDLETYTSLDDTQTETLAIPATTHYIKWIYTSKSSGNVALGNIKLYACESVAISDAGWATYCSSKALDFTDVTGLTAYTASKEGDVVKFNKVTGKVPANEGLLVKGATTNIPVCASASAIENLLVGVTVNTNKDANTIFVLKNGANGIGFYKNTNAFTVRANSAYLDATAVAGARTFIALDDEETTNIDLTSVFSKGEAVVYDLQGRRVAQPTKGLYIVNGKKVVIK